MEIAKTIIVGGNFGFGLDTKKESSIVRKSSTFIDCDVINGGTFEDLKNVNLSGYKLVIWMPNIDNGYNKVYPKKDIGSILIVSKVLREDRTEFDAITRIFKMHGNAVIAIDTSGSLHSFKLLDALGNVWVDTPNLETLCEGIITFMEWSSESIRKRCKKVDIVDFSEYTEFMRLYKQVADKFESTNGRFFGNTSTRCMKMFPTMKIDETYMIVSRRNVDKKRITTDDLVLTTFGKNGDVEYFGDNKPSVDTPIQLALYSSFPGINYMIHGHSYIEDAPFTEDYYPCGDMRELAEIEKTIEGSGNDSIINLKNHGFLIFASSLENLRLLINTIEFVERKVGFETV